MPNRPLSVTLLAALLVGCVATPGQPPEPTAGRGAGEPAASSPGGRAARGPLDPAPGGQLPGERPQVSVQPGGPPAPGAGVGPQAAGIIGKLKSPTGLVAANTGPGLAQAFSLLGLDQSAIAGARLTLVDAAGTPVSAEQATSGPDGAFAFAALPPGDDAFFVQAAFQAGGQPVLLRAPAEPPEAGGGLTLEVDVATTLVAAKLGVLLARGALPKRPRAQARLSRLAARVREALAAETLPFLGAGTRDLLAAFDQLALDDAQVAKVAGELTAAAAEPSEAWTVSAAVDEPRLRALGVLGEATDGSGLAEEGGVFAVDAQGRLHLATAGSPVRILRLEPDGTASEVATLPAAILPPVSLAFAPDGELVAAGLDARRALWIAAGTGGELARRAGGPFLRARDEDALAALGRIAVDAEGQVFVPMPRLHVVLAYAPGQALPRKVAGRWAQPGHQDGPGGEALFRFPYSLATGPDGAIYVADTRNACVRRLVKAEAGWAVETVAGRPGEAFYRNGRGAFARIGRPTGVALDAAGNLFLTDAGSRRVRRVSPQGSVFLVAGSGAEGTTDGPGWRASFSAPQHLAAAADGTLFLHDRGPGPDGLPRDLLRRIAPPAP